MKLKESVSTETYISDGGYYVIAQTMVSDDCRIVLSPDQIRHIIKDMRLALKTSNFWWFDKVAESDF